MNPATMFSTGAMLFATAGHAVSLDCKAVQTPQQQRDEDTIRRIEQGWLAAEYHGNVEFLDCLLTTGYAVIATHDGTIRSKADLLARVASNKGRTTPVPLLATQVVVNGEHATAYSSMTMQVKAGGTKEVRFVDSYVFADGTWRAVGGVDL
jgi:hypothetical protein